MWMRPVFCLVSLLFITAVARADDLGTRIEARLGDGFDGPATEEEFETLAVVDGFYRARDMRPIWVGEAGALPRARQMADLLLLADRDGLVSGDYGAGAVGPLLAATDPGRLADLEVRLSLGLVQFVADLGEGRTAPNVADPELFPYRDKVDKPAVLEAAEGATDLAELVDGYRPHSPRYDRLRLALGDYRAMAELGGWEAISEGPTLKPEMTDPRIGQVRSRLLLWGDLSSDADLAGAGGDPDFYDEALVAAVVRMQYRHGLEQDGLIGRGTLAALNVPVEDRIDQIVLNLERRRWLPDDLGRRYVFVNLADFNLKVVDGERTIHDTRVVVGLPYRRTPVFSEEISYLELNPYWHVPPSIARRDILPRLKSDPGYLAANNYTLFSDWSAGASVVDPLSVDWSAVTPRGFGYKIRQEPGDNNALGRIKFMFPNRFSIYLHDTPAKSLFNRAERSFSSGCIRVMNPLGLAEVVLDGMPGWDRARIDRIIETGAPTVVSLAEPLPVHLSYQTAWVNKDGSVHFRSDIYERDVVLAAALMGTRRPL